MGPTFFFSSTLMALASFRKMALPHSRSRREVNWYHFHFRKAHSASSHSRSVHWTVGEPVGHQGKPQYKLPQPEFQKFKMACQGQSTY